MQSVRNYHDSGSYASDLQTVGSQALAFMQRQAKAVRKAGKCPKKKKKKCKPAPKLAITLDIDETSLSNYTELEAGNFANATGALAVAITTADSPAIAPTLAMYQRARQMNISVFFITGRQPGLEALTRQNLTLAGYTDVAGLYMKPPADGDDPLQERLARRDRAAGIQGHRQRRGPGERPDGRRRRPQLQAPEPLLLHRVAPPDRADALPVYSGRPGEVSEWLKELAWKASGRAYTCLVGSNPTLSVQEATLRSYGRFS